MTFQEFKFHPDVAAGITAAGYVTPTPIQTQAIPAVMAGRDVMGLAQTGTGKTAAFALPILHRLQPGPRGKVRALVVAPTRVNGASSSGIAVAPGPLPTMMSTRKSSIAG